MQAALNRQALSVMQEMYHQSVQEIDPYYLSHFRVLENNVSPDTSSQGNNIQEVEVQVDKLSGLLIKLKDANEESKSVTKASAMKGVVMCSYIFYDILGCLDS